MEQVDWMAQVSTTIASEVRRIRQERGMSAQRLSDRCAELGAPIPRTVLSNLENGRRGNVTVAEMLVLAAALDVPPATLVFPVGYQAAVESLPGQAQPPTSAIEWLAGLKQVGDAATKKSVPLYRFQKHERNVQALGALLAQVAWENSEKRRRELDDMSVRRAMVEEEVRHLRDRALRASRELAGIDGPTSELERLSVEQHTIHEALYRAEAQLADAKEREQVARVHASMAENHRNEARSVIQEIRADREDMKRRGWVLPDLSGVVAKALESELSFIESAEQ